MKRPIVRTAILGATFALAGCGGGAIMTSFDTERDRVRGALTADAQCYEKPFGEGRRMECMASGGAFLLVMTAEKSGELRFSMTNAQSGRPDNFWKVLTAYGFQKADADGCFGEGPFVRQFDAYRVTCEKTLATGLTAYVTQEKRV